MPNIISARFTALDFESAGTAPGATDEPIQMAWGGMEGVEIDQTTFFSTYLSTERSITWAAQKVHGITREDLKGAPSLIDLWPRVRGAMQGRIMVAHGAGTERRFLHAFPFHGFGPWVDTLAVARAVYPNMPDYSLESLLENLRLVAELDSLCGELRWHHALYDAVGCLVFLRHLLHHSEIAEAPLAWLLHPDSSPYYKNRQF
ncbi:MAG: 3'-5' exonuclease [Verrucomicrobiales bacterium]